MGVARDGKPRPQGFPTTTGTAMHTTTTPRREEEPRVPNPSQLAAQLQLTWFYRQLAARRSSPASVLRWTSDSVARNG